MAKKDSAVDQIKAAGKEKQKNIAFQSLNDSAGQKQAAWEAYYASLQDAANQEGLLKQGANIDLVQGSQDGAYQLLNNLLSRGYIDADTRESIFNDLNAAGGLATQYSQDGGISPETMRFLEGEYSNARGQANTLAERGGLTIDEYQRILNSGRNDMMRQGRNAAEATFNQANASGSPFAAASLMASNAANTGAQMAKQRAELDKYQSDTRMEGMKMLEKLLGLASGTMLDVASNKGKGLDMLGDLIGKKVGVSEKSNSFSDAVAGGAFNTLNSLVSFQDQYDKKGNKIGTNVSTPYSGEKLPWSQNNYPYAPGMTVYQGTDPNMKLSGGKLKQNNQNVI